MPAHLNSTLMLWDIHLIPNTCGILMGGKFSKKHQIVNPKNDGLVMVIDLGLGSLAAVSSSVMEKNVRTMS